MSELPGKRIEAQEALLDLFEEMSGLPVALYEIRYGAIQPATSGNSVKNFEKHCELIQGFPGGKKLCEADQCNRAHGALHFEKEELGVCYAGMWNQLVPIRAGGKTCGALLYGEMQVDTEECRTISLQKHHEAVKRLGLNPDQSAHLHDALLKAKTYAPERLDRYKALFTRCQEWFYALALEEECVKLSVQRVTHEIQTRLQAVVAESENLATDATSISSARAKQMATGVLNAALALDTVIQTLGEYMEDYRFVEVPVIPLLREAKRIYETEASRKGVDIVLDLDNKPESPNPEISKHHFQHAINNIVHNAVKYSFRTVPSGGKRYVKIACRVEGNFVQISVSNYGVGILPEEIASRAIFRMDYQGKLTQGEFRTGSGKGLYFANAVVERHGGKIEVESKSAATASSQEGKPHQNRFTIILPLKQTPGV